MQLGRSIFGACQESAQMIKSMDTSSNSHMYYNFVTELALESGDWRTDTVFANVDIKLNLAKKQIFEGLGRFYGISRKCGFFWN